MLHDREERRVRSQDLHSGPGQFVQTNNAVGLHELARELSIWRGADKRVIIPPQDCKEAWAEAGHPNFQSLIAIKTHLLGYEMEAQEMAVMKKRCKARGLINITPIISKIKSEWA